MPRTLSISFSLTVTATDEDIEDLRVNALAAGFREWSCGWAAR